MWSLNFCVLRLANDTRRIYKTWWITQSIILFTFKCDLSIFASCKLYGMAFKIRLNGDNTQDTEIDESQLIILLTFKCDWSISACYVERPLRSVCVIRRAWKLTNRLLFSHANVIGQFLRPLSCRCHAGRLAFIAREDAEIPRGEFGRNSAGLFDGISPRKGDCRANPPHIDCLIDASWRF